MSNSFNYLNDSNAERSAYLHPAVYSPGVVDSTEDPRWIVIHHEDGIEYGPFDDLTYVGEDGRYYHVRVHAQWDPFQRNIKIWLSHELRDGGGGFNDSNSFTIRDWSNTPVHITISTAVANNTAPSFTLV